MNRRVAVALVLVVVGCPPSNPPTLSLVARPSRIANNGQVADIVASALNGDESLGRGSVKFTSTAGSLVAGETWDLDPTTGSVTIGFSCDVASDPQCVDTAQVLGEWVTGGTTVKGDVKLTLNGGTGGGGTGGGTGLPSPCPNSYPAFCGSETLEVGRLTDGGARVRERIFPFTISDIAPLCNGRVLVGDVTDNAVKLVDAVCGTTEATFPLAATPADLDFDPVTRRLYVAHPNPDAGFITEVDLMAMSTRTIALPAATDVGLSVASAPPYGVLVGLHSSASGDGRLLLMAPDGAVLTSASTNFELPDFIAWHQDTERAFMGNAGISPATLNTFRLDAGQLYLEQTSLAVNFIGSNGQDLVVAHDGSRLAFATGSGNGNYTIKAFHADDLTKFYADYKTDAYPGSADFAPDGGLFVGTNGSDVRLFDATSAAELRRREAPEGLIIDAGVATNCLGYADFTKTRFAPSGRFTVSLYDCSQRPTTVLIVDDVTRR